MWTIEDERAYQQAEREHLDFLAQTRDCRICGGDGWTDGSAELRRDGSPADTECLGCQGSGRERP